MNWKVTEEPTKEPISVADAKAYLRVQHSADDALIGDIIAAAESFCEEELDLAIMDQEITLKLDTFPYSKTIYLPRANLLSVTSVKYNDTDGAEQTFTDYTADTFSTPARIVNNTTDWPETEDKVNSVTIVYRAGFKASETGDGDLPPGAVVQAMRMLITHWYENRSTVVVGETTEPLQMAVSASLQKYRRMGV